MAKLGSERLFTNRALTKSTAGGYVMALYPGCHSYAWLQSAMDAEFPICSWDLSFPSWEMKRLDLIQWPRQHGVDSVARGLGVCVFEGLGMV